MGGAYVLVALALGVVADGLLRQTPWGLNLLLVLLVAMAAGWAMARWRGIRLAGEGRWLLPVVLIFAAALAWRDSPTVNQLNWTALLIAVSVAERRSYAGVIRRVGIWQYVGSAFYALARALAGLFPVLARDVPGSGVGRQIAAILRGALLALPLLLIFGGLFVSADPVFGDLIGNLFRWDDLLVRLFWMGFYTWVLGGLVRGVLVAAPPNDAEPPLPDRPLLGIVEVSVVLSALILLFAAFVVVQLPYLFGGTTFLAAATNLDLRDYARRGFFELVAVTGLALPVLLGAHRLLRGVAPARERVYRVLAGVLVLLLFVIVASAVLRLKLYQDLRGQSELRINAAVAIAWLTFLHVWFVATVLRGHASSFWFGAMVSGFLAILVINAINPQAMMVRANAGREDADPPIDDGIGRNLGPDAVPALVEALPSLNSRSQCRLAGILVDRWLASPEPDWRTWNWARAEARRTVVANEDNLRQLACQDPNDRRTRRSSD
jgi:hypothetical protein